MIKKFENFNEKTICVYHGLNGSPSVERILTLRDLNYKVHYPHIDFNKEWNKDKLKSLFIEQLNIIKDFDIIMGFSLGGYLAFELAGYLSKPLILINPSLDRSKTKLDIKYIDIDSKNDFSDIEIFLGENDKLIDSDITLNFIKDKNIKANITIIKGMEHRTPINYFSEIVKNSKILK